MNILGLIFSLLLILAYGFTLSWDKHSASLRLKNSYIGHEKVSRRLFNRYQSELYEKIPGKGMQVEKKGDVSKGKNRKPLMIELNRECAKINLLPLLQEGRAAQPLLYELSAKLIRTFYKPLFVPAKRFEYHFLDAFLKAAAKMNPLVLEKLDFEDPALQRLYYHMLKGTKTWSLPKKTGYPSLLDYVCASSSPHKICLFHAHPDLITVLFNEPLAYALYVEMHKKDAPLLTRELIERVAQKHHIIHIDPDLLSLLELGKPSHQEAHKTLIAEDKETHLILRKNVSLQNKDAKNS